MILADEKSRAEARAYVLERELPRPHTTWPMPLLFLAVVVVLGVAIGRGICLLLESNTASWPFSRPLLRIGAIFCSLLCASRPFAILCIRCYQHYAPENIRRCCMCKPTCSEYAILVMKRYCLFKALRLIYIRLFRTCTGKNYKIDFP